MRIAMLAPMWRPISAPFFGGLEILVNDLTLGLAQLGHEVTLIALRGSKLAASTLEEQKAAKHTRLVEITRTTKINTLPDPGERIGLYSRAFLYLVQHEAEFDIVHAHAPYDGIVYACATQLQIPLVNTVHMPYFPAAQAQIELISQIYQQVKNARAVTVSKACAANYGKSFIFDKVIYNGTHNEVIPFGNKGENFLLFVGRICRSKGVDLAIEIAQRANRKLVIAGSLEEPDFFESEIKPKLKKDTNILYLGNCPRTTVYKLMSQADGLLFPVRWEEPFGLVMVEAMAAGAPILSWNHGVASELVVNGRTGCLVPYLDVTAGVEAVDQLTQMKREDCRRHVEAHFTHKKMLDAYTAYYREVIDQPCKSEKIGLLVS